MSDKNCVTKDRPIESFPANLSGLSVTPEYSCAAQTAPRKCQYSKHNASTSPWLCNFVANALTKLMSIVYRWGVVLEWMYTLRNDISTPDGNNTLKMSKLVRILSGTSDHREKFNTSKSCLSHRKWNFNLAS